MLVNVLPAMTFHPTDRLFVLTGAGISAEAGLPPSEVREGFGTASAWRMSPRRTHGARTARLVWQFCSMRREDAMAAQPNAAHRALAAMERQMSDRFYLCTQNVDDLHERAGTRRVHHMHGTLFESRCTVCEESFPDRSLYPAGAALPCCQVCGAPVRPHIVWFGEIPIDMDGILRKLSLATVVLVVGTSGSVYPAAGFVEIAQKRRIRTVYVGPEEPLNAECFSEVILGTATEVLPSFEISAGRE